MMQGSNSLLSTKLVTSAEKLSDQRQIGEGGFGEVFVATHKDWGRVAFKKLRQTFIKETDKAVRQMVREVEILKDLRHTHTIGFIGIVFELGNYGIIFEYMKHGNVESFLNDFDVPLPWKVQMASDVALGMNYLHTMPNPIIHGDLKIQNVLVTDGFHVKVSDFGLSSWKQMSKSISRKTYCQGTLTHIPPEILADINVRADEKTDLYAFGVLVWEIFTGERPFKNVSNDAVIADAVMRGQRPSMTDLPHDTPEVITGLIEISWHHDRDQRRSFSEIKENLESYISTEERSIAAAKVLLQQQESQCLFPNPDFSLQSDGLSSISCGQPITGSSVLTNVNLPVVRNDTGNPGATDLTALLVHLRQDREDNHPVLPSVAAAAAASSLCQEKEKQQLSDELAVMLRVRPDESSPPRICQERSNGRLVEDSSSSSSNPNSGLRVGEGIISLHTSSGLNPPLEAGKRDSSSECQLKVTQPKTIHQDIYSRGPAAAAVGGDDSSFYLTSQSIPHRHLSPASHLQSQPATQMSSTPVENPVNKTRCALNRPYSVPETDALQSPETPTPHDREQTITGIPPSEWFIKKNDMEKREDEKKSNQKALRNDIAEGYYPKDGSAFRWHDHLISSSNHHYHPSHPQQVNDTFAPPPPYNFFSDATRQPGPRHHHLPQQTRTPFPPTSPQEAQHHFERSSSSEGAIHFRSNSDRGKHVGPTDTSKSKESSSVIIREQGKETTIINVHNIGSGVQIGNNNTMYIKPAFPSQQHHPTQRRTQPNSSDEAAATPTSVSKKKEPKKIVVPDKVVDTEAMMTVSESIAADWMRLARRLGLSDSDVDGFRVDFSHEGVKETAYQMLREWKMRKGPEAKMDVLAKALVDIKRHDIALKFSTS